MSSAASRMRGEMPGDTMKRQPASTDCFIWRPLRTVPAATAFRRWRGGADRTAAAALGERTGAALVVFGSVRRLDPDSVALRASVLDRSADRLVAEVEVRAPLDIEFDPDTGITSMTIEQITAEGLELSGTTESGGTFSSGMYATEGGLAKGVTSINGVTFELAVLGVLDGVAVLRIEML